MSLSTKKLCGELGLQSIDYYISKRQLGWLGHVSRMDFCRTPRRMLSSWVNHKRPKGCPNMTYGRGVMKALRKFGIDSNWQEIVQDRARLRDTKIVLRGMPSTGGLWNDASDPTRLTVAPDTIGRRAERRS